MLRVKNIRSVDTVCSSQWERRNALIYSSKARVFQVALPWACFASPLIYCTGCRYRGGETAVTLIALQWLEKANNVEKKVPSSDQSIWNRNKSDLAQHLSALCLISIHIWAIEFYKHKHSIKVNFQVAHTINGIIIQILTELLLLRNHICTSNHNRDWFLAQRLPVFSYYTAFHYGSTWTSSTQNKL